MQIQESKQGEILILTISEHLDSTTAAVFEPRLLGLVERGERKIIVDCGSLEYVNSAGLKVFSSRPSASNRSAANSSSAPSPPACS